MLRFKGSYSYGAEIEKYGRINLDVIDQLFRDIFTGYVYRDLPAELEKQGIETTAEQCRNQSAVIVGYYADEFKQGCLKFAQEASDGKALEIVSSDLDEFYLGLIRKMDAEMENEFGQHSDRYHNSLEDFTTQCMIKLPSKTIPSRCDYRNWKLGKLLTYENSLEHWQDVFENSNWSDAAILHRIDDVLSESIYDMLRQANGDLDETIQIALQSVYKNFFMGALADELRDVAIDRLEMNDDAKTLLRTVNDVADNTARRLEGEIVQRVEDLVGPMIDEYQAESM